MEKLTPILDRDAPYTTHPTPQHQPDKNAAPEADEAFKAISAAFTTLSDPDKRRSYDQFGDEDGPAAAAARANPFRHADVTPEEIFNMFFGMHGAAMGGGMGRGPGGFRVYRTHGGHPFGGGQQRYEQDPRHRGRGQHQYQQGPGQGQQQEHPLGVMGQLLQLLPVILLLFLSLFSFPHDGAERPYSLHRTERHPVLRETSVEHVYPNIPYYVSSAFSRDYARDRRRLFQVGAVPWVGLWRTHTHTDTHAKPTPPTSVNNHPHH